MNTITNDLVPVDEKPLGILKEIAAKYHMEPKPFQQMILATCFTAKDKSGALVTPSPAEFAAFLVVCNEHGLNPIKKEIYGFKSQSGAILPIVSVDGWANIINSHPSFDGVEFTDHMSEDGKSVEAITCRIYKKGSVHHVEVTEYLAECRRTTEPWKQYPRRMLRHKAFIQCARYAFGFSGIYDPDEGERIDEATAPVARVTPPAIPAAEKPIVEGEFKEVAAKTETPTPPPIPGDKTKRKTRAKNGDKPKAEATEKPVETENPAPPPIPADRLTPNKVRSLSKDDIDPEKIPPVEPVKAFLGWLEKKLATFERYETMETYWNDNISPRVETMFPFDQTEAMRLYKLHEARLTG